MPPSSTSTAASGTCILVTGCAGFIGSHLTELLLSRGDTVIGIDELNAYYNVDLKLQNVQLLKQRAIHAEKSWGSSACSNREESAVQAQGAESSAADARPSDGADEEEDSPGSPAASSLSSSPSFAEFSVAVSFPELCSSSASSPASELADAYTSRFHFYHSDVDNAPLLRFLFSRWPISSVIHLAARAGVRPSISQPHLYIHSNITATLTLLQECVRDRTAAASVPASRAPTPSPPSPSSSAAPSSSSSTDSSSSASSSLAPPTPRIRHFVYASSSSVYGDAANASDGFREEQDTDQPVSVYAASKKSCELLVSTFAHQYNLLSSGLRFFTVYGPRGRPDMLPFILLSAIEKGEVVRQFGDGSSSRDYTEVSDIVQGIVAIHDKRVVAPNDTNQSVASSSSSSSSPSLTGAAESPLVQRTHEVFNLGNSDPISLSNYIALVESITGKQARLSLLPSQPGDVQHTFANIDKARSMCGYQPTVDIETGMRRMCRWFREEFAPRAAANSTPSTGVAATERPAEGERGDERSAGEEQVKRASRWRFARSDRNSVRSIRSSFSASSLPALLSSTPSTPLSSASPSSSSSSSPLPCDEPMSPSSSDSADSSSSSSSLPSLPPSLLPSMLVATRIHTNQVSDAYAFLSSPSFALSVQRWARNALSLSQRAAIAVDCSHGRTDVFQRVCEALARVEGASERVRVVRIAPWGRFVPALNALLEEAVFWQLETLFFTSLEASVTFERAEALQHQLMLSDGLLVGARLDGHQFALSDEKPAPERARGEEPDRVAEATLSGATVPWNTLAMWRVSRLRRTGFLAVSEHAVKGGIEEVAVLALHSLFEQGPRAKALATLIEFVEPEPASSLDADLYPSSTSSSSSSSAAWDTEWADEGRRKWHQQKMASKIERAAWQLEQMGLNASNLGLKVKHMRVALAEKSLRA